jgi:hypothetical protein
MAKFNIVLLNGYFIFENSMGFFNLFKRNIPNVIKDSLFSLNIYIFCWKFQHL